MRSFAIVSALFTAAAFAAPATNADTALLTRTPAMSDVEASAQSLMDAKVAAGCNLLGCLAALAPASVTCAAALAEEGLNPIADAACFASALNNIANPPAACANC
ncbi:hypothetical protein BU26DRAFT_571438 [Trematosphaeria pertusa]|uniref:Fungal calcium binding protein domain-containing protein n=1 Tax=Trematosphaeria pertusa TaxID=390896 RepID=A0A6A6HU96_9PLEO|nr:uncharacterized protein BU26DRAFT_571438 [Trematosphaeria pertusa]KAF2241676.1 hypothetical protein BU26DRAFT_571438 [Trematosphaeria pertusa]